MIRGYKPASYTTTFDANGHKIERERRQCCHCQYLWEYVPGSGDRRGYCLKHDAFVCARAECQAQQEQMLAQHFARTGKLLSCISYEEWNEGLMESVATTNGKFTQDFTVTPAGVIVPLENG